MLNTIPTWQAIDSNLRDLLVLKAEELYLTAGGDLGTVLVEQLLGVSGVNCLPSDFFADGGCDLIQPALLEVSGHVKETYGYLSAGALGTTAAGRDIDGDYLVQQHVDFLELFLASIPSVAPGAWDGTRARHGAVHSLWRAGVAWSRLVEFLDRATNGDFLVDPLTPVDLAVLSGLGEGSMRNLIGPARNIRTGEADETRKGRRFAGRAFASVRGTDALAWLRTRKAFTLRRPRPGLLSDRMERIDDPAVRGRAALVAGLVLGETPDSLGAALGGMPRERLRRIGDGVPDAATERLVAHVEEKDRGRTPDTAPATPEG